MKKLIVALLILGGLGYATYYGLQKMHKGQESKISILESHISKLKHENIPMLFRIEKKSDSTISATIKFQDADGFSIAKKTFDLVGEELVFDFLTVRVDDQYLAFPFKVYTDALAPNNGINLADLYNDDGYPLVYYSEHNGTGLNEALMKVFEKVRTGKPEQLDEYFGSAVHDVKKVNEFALGQVYKIVSRAKGGIEILED